MRYKKLIILSVIFAILEAITITIRVQVLPNDIIRTTWWWILLMDDLTSIALWVIGWSIAEEIMNIVKKRFKRKGK